MKKTFTTLLCALSAIFSIYAQRNFDGGPGLKVAWDYNIPSTDLVYLDSGSGVSAGVFYSFPVWQNMYIEPELDFFYNTMDLSYLDLYVDDTREPVSQGTWKNTGLRIPLKLGYSFGIADNITMSVYTGPQLNIGLSLNEKYDRPDTSSSNLYRQGWRRLDAQWLIGVKLHYLDNFFAEIGGGLGFTNMLKHSSYPGNHARRNIFAIGVGYQF